MGRRRGMMSDRFKEELAKDLGFYDVVKEEGYGGISARDAGNMTKRAVQLAQTRLSEGRSE
ncbi:protein sspF [Pontibacillus halophilus JSM 076056 = DSM 19796]|uniref:Protein sspF n=1 Tax=Pontibacillus halophilus JSM 076056 = DSM 19796 TaxID=1385510 RepID=A0A0A5GFU9_9BACI|nr:small, acid-soluble spore protein, alpha/beta type [Pontibacillus halophilus]KGX90088.1 protein sspF [Pontibacillus halophilus JSM 076056 = DSM 19796]